MNELTKITQEKLNELLDRHEEFMKSRYKEEGQLILKNYDLSGLDFGNRNLKCSQFFYSKFSNNNFKNTNFDNTVFAFCDISDVNFKNSNLHAATFHTTKLKNINLLFNSIADIDWVDCCFLNVNCMNVSTNYVPNRTLTFNLTQTQIEGE